ncbi:HNH endonuclease [Streptomyces sp. NPDC085614]|uniref:HNH endonuclease n=1 Tax=Streptomyces sp. NPDC085614 TaxID=3365733 RepID=UPI0037D8344A
MSEPIRYTRELLLRAAEHCRSIDQVVAFLGVRPYANLHGYLWRRFDHYGIDVSHFRGRRRRKSTRRPAPHELARVVARSDSLTEVLRQLDLPDNGSRRRHLKQWVAEDGLSTTHFLGRAHRRGKPSTIPLRAAADVLVRHDGKRRTRSAVLRRALREAGVPERCAECGTDPMWHGKPMTLEIDHISGDWSDDRAENLRFLCPNCHAITGTWCRGGRRNPRGEHPRGREGPPATMSDRRP